MTGWLAGLLAHITHIMNYERKERTNAAFVSLHNTPLSHINNINILYSL